MVFSNFGFQKASYSQHTYERFSYLYLKSDCRFAGVPHKIGDKNRFFNFKTSIFLTFTLRLAFKKFQATGEGQLHENSSYFCLSRHFLYFFIVFCIKTAQFCKNRNRFSRTSFRKYENSSFVRLVFFTFLRRKCL